MSNITALMIAIVFLYSFHHWIGATVLLAWTLTVIVVTAYQESTDPLGLNKLYSILRTYK